MPSHIAGRRGITQGAVAWSRRFMSDQATLHDCDFTRPAYALAPGVNPAVDILGYELATLGGATLHDCDFPNQLYTLHAGAAPVTPITDIMGWQRDFLALASWHDCNFASGMFRISTGVAPEIAFKDAWISAYLSRAHIALDFTSSTYGVDGMPTSFTSIANVARAGAALVKDSTGVYTSVAADTLRVSDQGALVEGPATNPGPHNVYTDATYGAVATDGIELISNPAALSDISGWVDKSTGTGSSAWGNPGLALMGGSSGIGALETSFAVVAGQTYTVQLTLVTNNTTIRIGTTSGGVDVQADIAASAATRYQKYTAASSGTWYLRFQNPNNNTSNVHFISCQKFSFPSYCYGAAFGGNGWSIPSKGTLIVAGVGTSNGVPYIDLRIQRLAALAAATSITVCFTPPAYIAAANGDTWTISAYLSLQSGSLANVASLALGNQERTSGGGAVGVTKALQILTLISATPQRFVLPVTLSGGATTAKLQTDFVAVLAVTGAVDVTLRLSVPQHENNGVPASVGAVAITGAGSGLSNGTRTFTVTNGTGSPAQFTAAVSGGAITGGATVTVPGSYTAFPSVPSVTVDSGIVGGATFTAAPSDMSAQGFASSPILTTNGTVSRTADVITELLTSSSPGSLIVWATTPRQTGTSNTLWTWDDGSAANSLTMIRDAAGHIRAIVMSGGATQANLDLGFVAANTKFKVFFAWAAGDFVAVLNGGAPISSGSGILPVGLARILYGSDATGNFWGNYISHNALFSSRLPTGTGAILTS